MLFLYLIVWNLLAEVYFYVFHSVLLDMAYMRIWEGREKMKKKERKREQAPPADYGSGDKLYG